MSISKKLYVKRLKRMLTNRARPCMCCPAEPRYRVDSSLVPIKTCMMCQAFVGLKFIPDPEFEHKDGAVSCGCPCYRPGKLGAVERAFKKIAEYEAKHGEI